jgi:non-ribosomal peptide synthetase component F
MMMILIYSIRRTGDLVKYENGVLVYQGRLDRQIKRFGQRVNCEFVETLITTCIPKVLNCS